MALSFALGATLLWSLTNLLDKGLVQRYGAGGSLNALIVISALFPVLLVPLSIAMSGFHVGLAPMSIGLLILSGICQISWVGLYLTALQNDDVTVVMPLMSLSPVFAWIAGMVMLGEFPGATELVGSAVILISALVLSYHRKKASVNYKLVAMTGLAACLVALTNALFKLGTGDDSLYWAGLCWQSFGTFLVGAFAVIFHSSTRDTFAEFLRNNAKFSISVNLANESLTLGGNALFGQALLLGQLMVIQSTEAFQPVFVFLLGTILSYFFPKHLTEDLSRFALIQKVIGIFGIGIGSVILFHGQMN